MHTYTVAGIPASVGYELGQPAYPSPIVNKVPHIRMYIYIYTYIYVIYVIEFKLYIYYINIYT